MPLLLNTSSGLAEDLAPEHVNPALEAGTHAVPLMDPKGNLHSAAFKDAPELLSQGYRQPTQDESVKLLEHAKYSAPSQLAKTFAEGALEGALPLGIGTGLERAAGVDPKEMLARREHNPISHGAGEIAGIAGSSLIPGVGQAELMGRAGASAAEHAAAAGISPLAQAAIKHATSMAFLQGGDEAAKAFEGDPQQSAESIAAHIGLAGLMGGAMGAAPEMAPRLAEKLGSFVNGIKTRVAAVADKASEPLAGVISEPIFHKTPFSVLGERIAPGTDQGAERLDRYFAKYLNESPEAKAYFEPNAVPQALEGAAKATAPADVGVGSLPFKDLIPGALGGLLSHMSGHSGLGGFIAGSLGRYLGPAAARYGKAALFKALGSDQPFNAEAFATLTKNAVAAWRANETMQRATSGVFKETARILPDSYAPSAKDIDKIKEHVKDFAANPTAMVNLAGDTGHYAPEQAVALGAVASKAAAYLQSIAPNTTPAAPLDPPRKPAASENLAYDRQVALAAKPLMLLQHLKDHTLTPKDIATVQTIYPSLYNQMTKKVLASAMDDKAAGKAIAYHTRVGMSMMLGQPLDSSMSPMALQLTSQAAKPSPSNQPQAPIKHKTASLGKTAQLDALPGQAAEAKRTKNF